LSKAIEAIAECSLCWDDVYLDLVTTYEHIVTHRTRTYGGDATGPASRHVKFPVGVGLGAMGMDASGDGDDEIAFGFVRHEFKDEGRYQTQAVRRKATPFATICANALDTTCAKMSSDRLAPRLRTVASSSSFVDLAASGFCNGCHGRGRLLQAR